MGLQVKTNWEVGPAFFAVLVQTVGAIVAVTMLYASLQNTVLNTERTTAHLAKIQEKQADTQEALTNRMTRVETIVDTVRSSLDRVSAKIDLLNAPTKN